MGGCFCSGQPGSEDARALQIRHRLFRSDGPAVRAGSDLAPWDAVVSLSAVSGYNTGAFLDEVLQLLPEGPLWFPEDAVSDVALETMIAEVVREKVLRHFREEVPHSVGVKVDELEDGRSLLRAEASIFVERDSQKAMLIGAKGAQVKQIGTRSGLIWSRCSTSGSIWA